MKGRWVDSFTCALFVGGWMKGRWVDKVYLCTARRWVDKVYLGTVCRWVD